MVKSKDEVENLALLYVQEASKVFFIKKAYLFGSYVKNKATTYSDIDVALVSPDFEKIPETILLKMLFRLARHIDPLIEPIPITEDEISNPTLGTVAIDVVKEGKIIFTI
ncbi:MAG: nucleotidyltransferase domain-containing protein [Oligoflexia bacterium]|nr:nucleotidyltransferase domain-containing protein [Oligoflexia bacterium]